MPLRNSYLDQPFQPQAQNFQLPAQTPVQNQPAQDQSVMSQDKFQVVPGIRGWLDRVLLRGGGLRPGRDNDKINAYTSMIQSGALPDDQINALKERNPDAAPIISQAQFANRQRKMVTQIMQNRFSDPQKPDYAGAIADLNRAGQPDMANKLTQEWHMSRMAQAPLHQTAFMEKKALLDDQLSQGQITPQEYQNNLNILIGTQPKPGTGTTNLQKLQTLRETLPQGSKERDEVDKLITKMTSQPPSQQVHLSPEAISQQADVLESTGSLPSLGMGGIADRAAILNAHAKKYPGSGTTMVVNKAVYKADSMGLNALTKDIVAIKPYKDMLDKNGDILITLAKKVSRTSPAIANRPLNWLAQNVQVNPDVSEYLAQMRIFQTEAARVLNNPRLVGQLTDTARQELEQVVSGNMPLSVTERVVTRLRQDGDNRVGAMINAQQELTKKIGKTPTAQPATKTEPNVVNWDTLK